MLSPPVYAYLQERKKEGLPPDFLRSLVALANFIRLSLLKAARAVMSGAAYRKSGSPILFNPCTRRREQGHPSRGLGLVASRESGGRSDSRATVAEWRDLRFSSGSPRFNNSARSRRECGSRRFRYPN